MPFYHDDAALEKKMRSGTLAMALSPPGHRPHWPGCHTGTQCPGACNTHNSGDILKALERTDTRLPIALEEFSKISGQDYQQPTFWNKS